MFPDNAFVSPQYGNSSRLVVAEDPAQQQQIEGQLLCCGSGEWYNFFFQAEDIIRDADVTGVQTCALPIWLTAQQIEAVRVCLSRHMKKVGKLYLRVFPDKPVTKKPAETRMGKGKGGVDHWVAVVKRNRILCEISGIEEAVAREVLKSAAYKLPIRTKIVKKTVDLS